jgi:chitin synthase
LASVTAEAGDGQKFAKLKLAFKSASFPKRAVASICQVLAAILHLGQLEFHNDKTRNADAALVTNREQLAWTGELLGVGPDDFEAALHVKTKTNGWDRVTAFLDPEGCKANADDLSRNLYSLLFAWLNEYLNSKLSREDFKTFVALVDFPGPQRSTSAADHGLEAFAFNLASERAHAFVLEHVFERNKTEYETEDVARALPGLAASYFGNAECVRILTSVPGGLVHIIDDQSRRRAKTDSTMLEALGRRWGNHSSFGWRAGDDRTGRVGTFTVNHWEGQVTYSTDGMLERNRAAMVSTDFVALFAGSTNPFLQQLFAREAESAATAGAKDDGGLKPSSTLKRGPSTKRRKAVEAVEDAVVADGKAKAKGDVKTLLDPFNDSLTELFDALQEVRSTGPPRSSC